MTGYSPLARMGAFIWLCTVGITVALASLKSPSFDSSLMALLPEVDQKPLQQKAALQLSQQFSDNLMLMLSGKDEIQLKSTIPFVANTLEDLGAVAEVRWKIDDKQLQAHQTELKPYRFSVLDSAIRQRLSSGQVDQITKAALAHLFSPLSATGATLTEDPFGLYRELLLNRPSSLNLQLSDNLFKVAGSAQPTYIMTLTLSGDPFSPRIQHQLLTALESIEAQLHQKGISLAKSGMLLHAAAGAEQATHEITTIGIGSLIGILAGVLLVFRRLTTFITLLFPVTVGCLTASAACILIFDRVHLVTFAFGAGLVGVSIDYALHYLTERQVLSPTTILRKLLPGLALGLMTSVIAYSAQALAPFPGLRQMATFSVIGLTASWLTVVLWFPMVTRNTPVSPLQAAQWLYGLRDRFPQIERHQALKLLLIPPVLITFYIISNAQPLSDIRQLQTSPKELIEEDQQLLATLGATNSSQFILIRGDSLELCLQMEEAISANLDRLTDQGLIDGYRALSQVLPSQKRQSENVALVSQLYTHQLPSFYQKLGLPESTLEKTQKEFEQLKNSRLTISEWSTLQRSEAWADYLISSASSTATVIRFTGQLTSAATKAIQSITTQHANTSFVDQVSNISNLLSDYQQQISHWILMAYLVITAVLFMRYKRQLWRVITPPLLASLLTLALLTGIEGGINLFHLMALILVLGIGLDMGIFLLENDQSAHTWLAVSLSCYTSLLAFGLLALSKTPVLHHFGLTVLIGLSFVWLLAPMMRPTDPSK